MDHPGVVILADLVARIARGEASAEQRTAAVALAIHLVQLDVISKGKCVEVVRDAGPTTPVCDEAIRVLQEHSSGDVPPEWAQSPVPLRLSEEALARIATLVDSDTLAERKPSRLSDAARAARRPRPPAELVGALQDRIHDASGPLRVAKSVKVPSKK